MPPLAMIDPSATTGVCRMPNRHPRRPVQFLLVEDSPSDAELMVEALRESTLPLRIAIVEDGEEAIRYLRRQGPHQEAPRPDLILLDLHLPRKNGHEVLAEIKEDESLRLIPVILLTSFATDEAIRQAYDLHANCCVSKPSDLDQFTQAVHRIESFWLQHARLLPAS
jgi:two-component system, chemotaxis family, response regulator Rcp1